MMNAVRPGLHCICKSMTGVFCILLAVGCSEDLTESPIPARKVSYSCNITTINAAMGQADVPNLDAQPGYVLINDYRNMSEIIGVAGLLLYHSAFEDAFYAYDLACPYCWKHQQKAVQLGMKDAFTAQCTKCESEFGAVQYGSPAPTAGPANEENLMLRPYQARLSGYNTLVVTN